MLPGGYVVSPRRIHDHDALLTGGLDVDILHADPGPADNLEILSDSN